MMCATRVTSIANTRMAYLDLALSENLVRMYGTILYSLAALSLCMITFWSIPLTLVNPTITALQRRHAAKAVPGPALHLLLIDRASDRPSRCQPCSTQQDPYSARFCHESPTTLAPTRSTAMKKFFTRNGVDKPKPTVRAREQTPEATGRPVRGRAIVQGI
jgi:hypothetical protein